MSRYIDSVFIFRESVEATKILNSLSHCFKRNNVLFSTDTSVIFNDFRGEEKESEFVSSEDEAIRNILSWSALGGTEYNFSGYKLSVFFWGIRECYVDVITISLIASAYLKHPQIQKDYDELISQIHHNLQAKRTISDYELLSPNSFWIEELNRVKNNVFEGQYPLDIRSK